MSGGRTLTLSDYLEVVELACSGGYDAAEIGEQTGLAVGHVTRLLSAPPVYLRRAHPTECAEAMERLREVAS